MNPLFDTMLLKHHRVDYREIAASLPEKKQPRMVTAKRAVILCGVCVLVSQVISGSVI